MEICNTQIFSLSSSVFIVECKTDERTYHLYLNWGKRTSLSEIMVDKYFTNTKIKKYKSEYKCTVLSQNSMYKTVRR